MADRHNGILMFFLLLVGEAIIFCVPIMDPIKVFLFFFSLSVFLKFLRHNKLIVKYRLLFENIVYKKVSVFDQKSSDSI